MVDELLHVNLHWWAGLYKKCCCLFKRRRMLFFVASVENFSCRLSQGLCVDKSYLRSGRQAILVVFTCPEGISTVSLPNKDVTLDLKVFSFNRRGCTETLCLVDKSCSLKFLWTITSFASRRQSLASQIFTRVTQPTRGILRRLFPRDTLRTKILQNKTFIGNWSNTFFCCF